MLLEGLDDIRALESFIDNRCCEIVNSFGRPNLLEAVSLLDEDGFGGICGIIDPDFSAFIKVKYKSDNILCADFGDLDMMLFMSSALDKYISNVSDRVLIQAFEEKVGCSIRERILDTASQIGASRVVSLQRNVRVCFRDMKMEEFVDGSTLQLLEEEFYHGLIRRSPNSSCGAQQLKTWSGALIREASRRGLSKAFLCQGHDVAAMLGLALRSVLGRRTSSQTWGSEVETGLRLAFSRSEFEITNLYGTMKEWENRNTPFILLRK